MSKRKKYTPKPVTLPALVARELKPFEFELPEMITLDTFRRGMATEQSMRNLEDYMNLILIANDMKPATANTKLADALVWLVDSVFKRYFKTKAIGLNAIERDMINDLIFAYQQYWNMQSADFYNTCLDELRAFYKERNELRTYKHELNLLGMEA